MDDRKIPNWTVVMAAYFRKFSKKKKLLNHIVKRGEGEFYSL